MQELRDKVLAMLTPFAQYTQKPLGKVVEGDVRRFLDEYEGFNESDGDC